MKKKVLAKNRKKRSSKPGKRAVKVERRRQRLSEERNPKSNFGSLRKIPVRTVFGDLNLSLFGDDIILT